MERGIRLMKQRVNMDIDKELWKQVTIKCAELGIEKKQFVEEALKNKLKDK